LKNSTLTNFNPVKCKVVSRGRVLRCYVILSIGSSSHVPRGTRHVGSRASSWHSWCTNLMRRILNLAKLRLIRAAANSIRVSHRSMLTVGRLHLLDTPHFACVPRQSHRAYQSHIPRGQITSLLLPEFRLQRPTV
jgi:hypothetical protein